MCWNFAHTTEKMCDVDLVAGVVAGDAARVRKALAAGASPNTTFATAAREGRLSIGSRGGVGTPCETPAKAAPSPSGLTPMLSRLGLSTPSPHCGARAGPGGPLLTTGDATPVLILAVETCEANGPEKTAAVVRELLMAGADTRRLSTVRDHFFVFVTVELVLSFHASQHPAGLHSAPSPPHRLPPFCKIVLVCCSWCALTTAGLRAWYKGGGACEGYHV
jgi:hypothetical protein